MTNIYKSISHSKNLFLLLLFSIIYFNVEGSTIKVTVIDSKSKETIPFATIQVLKDTLLLSSGITDINGQATFKFIDASKINIVASYLGYTTKQVKNVSLSQNSINYVEIELESTTKLLSSIIVTEYVVPMVDRNKAVCSSSITTKQLSGAINIRGARSSNSANQSHQTNSTKTFIDGQRVVGNANLATSAITTLTRKEFMKLGTRNTNDVISISAGTFNPASSSSTISLGFKNGQIDEEWIYQPVHDYYKEFIHIDNSSPCMNTSTTAIVDSSTTRANEKIEEEILAIDSKLTATELNDFSKWELWNDITKNELNTFKSLWKMNAEKRYSVLVINESHQPIINAEVKLVDKKNKTIWATRTDNTGKAELWGNFIEGQISTVSKLIVLVDDKEFEIKKPVTFQDGINVFKIPVAYDVPNKIEIAFVVDATSSMDDEIDFLKSDLQNIIKKTKAKFNNELVALGSVFYQCPGNSYVTSTSKLTLNTAESINFISNKLADGGGEEAVDQGFMAAIDNLNWSVDARTRILFFLLDEQPTTDDKSIATMQKYTQLAAKKGIRIVPIIASAENIDNAQSLEFLMRTMALATNGTYVALTDDSQIGDVHAAPTTYEYEVETLNALLMRLINQYCQVLPPKNEMNDSIVEDTLIISNKTILATHQLNRASVKEKTMIDQNIVDFTKYVENTNLDGHEQIDSVIPTGILEPVKIQEPFSVKIYPNPAIDKVNIEIEGLVEDIYISDNSGKLMERKNVINQTRIELDFSNYASGTYTISASVNGTRVSKKIIVTH